MAEGHESRREAPSGEVSLDFTVNRFFMKLFNTNNMHIVNTCQLNFAFELPSVIQPKRLIKFESATDGS